MAGASPDSNTYLFPNSFNGNLGMFTQAPSAATWFTLDYSTWATHGLSIVSASYVVTPVTGPTLAVAFSTIISFDGGLSTQGLAFLVSGGVAGQRYNIAASATFSDNSVKTDQIVISVVPINGTSLGISTISTPEGGANLLAGSGAPTPGLGSDGDYYVDITANVLYGPRASGAWPSPGVPFGTIAAIPALTITGNSSGVAPSSSVGLNSDYFLDLSSGLVFGPKASGAWPGTGAPVAPISAANFIAGSTAGSAPSNTIGANGQYFLDTSSGKMWGPKASGAWSGSSSKLDPLLTNAGTGSGAATLSGGVLAAAQIPTTLLNFKGSWNANTNSPTLVSATGTQGQFYEVSVAGSTTLDGTGPWNVSDLAWFDGTKWGRIGANGGGVGGQSTTAQGRLTLTTGTPVMTSPVVAGGTIFYTPYLGNLVPIWNGSQFISQTFTEMSQTLADATKSPGAASSGNVYDMFVWNDSGTLRCTRGPTWVAGSGSNVVRGTGAGSTALTRVNGLLVNANAITNGPIAGAGVYVGTIATDSGGATATLTLAGGTAATIPGNLPVWNMYNRVQVSIQALNLLGAYTYSSATSRVTGGNANNIINFVCGLYEDNAVVSLSMSAQTVAVSGAHVGFTIDELSGGSDTGVFGPVNVSAVGAVANSNTVYLSARVPNGSGFNTLRALENSDGTNANTINTSGQTGILLLLIKA